MVLRLECALNHLKDWLKILPGATPRVSDSACLELVQEFTLLISSQVTLLVLSSKDCTLETTKLG